MIDFISVTKNYAGKPILLDVSFHIDPGEFVFLTGKSGAGKTTIMRLLTGQTKHDQGTITFDAHTYGKIKGKELLDIRRKIGVIYQDYKLLPDRTVAENIAMGLEIAGKSKAEIASRVSDLLTLIDLAPEKANAFPSQLSGGEAQRVCIARALATAPRVIFADEPTGNLDDTTGELITSLLLKLQELGTTVIMATHNTGLVQKFGKRTIHIKDKKVESDEQAKPKKEKAEKVEKHA